jgi:hypothetical protein
MNIWPILVIISGPYRKRLKDWIFSLLSIWWSTAAVVSRSSPCQQCTRSIVWKTFTLLLKQHACRIVWSRPCLLIQCGCAVQDSDLKCSAWHVPPGSIKSLSCENESKARNQWFQATEVLYLQKKILYLKQAGNIGFIQFNHSNISHWKTSHAGRLAFWNRYLDTVVQILNSSKMDVQNLLNNWNPPKRHYYGVMEPSNNSQVCYLMILTQPWGNRTIFTCCIIIETQEPVILVYIQSPFYHMKSFDKHLNRNLF